MNSIKIVEVTPASRAPFSKGLTFFSLNDDLVEGQVVFVEIRGKRIPAVISSIQSLTDKNDVKRLSFQIKKLGRQTGKLFMGKSFARWSAGLANKLLVTESELLSVILPANTEKIANAGKGKIVFFDQKVVTRPGEILCIEGSFEKRVEYYVNSILDGLKNKSLLIIVPSHSHGKALKQKLEDLDLEAQKNIKIATPTYALFNLEDVGAIVIEKEAANYRQISSPFIDTREYITALAEVLRIRLYLADDFSSLDARARTNLPVVKLVRVFPREEVVDLKSLKTKTGAALNILSLPFRGLIDRAMSKKTNVLVISARRGKFSSIICGDCAQEAFEGATLCANCGSWKLAPLGIGLEGVASQIKGAYPNLWEHFIFVTEAMLPRITNKFDSVVVAYIDSLFAIPGFRIRERIFRSIVEARNLAKSDFLIQTRRIDDPIFKQAIEGATREFADTEMKSRLKFGYPPAMHIIKVTTVGKRDIIRQPISDWPSAELLAKLLPMRGKAKIELDPESIL